MKIKLLEIKESTRVRKTLNLEQLDELKASFQEEGQLVPVKVRPVNDGYQVVFGHRRVQAAKDLGWDEIEAIVEATDDNKTIIQSLTENVVREDMAAIDIAKALAEIKERTGETNEQIGKRFGWSGQLVWQYLQMLDYEATKAGFSLGMRHVQEAKAGTGGNKELTEEVLKKAAEEGLSTRQTRNVAERVRQADEFDGKKGVQAVIKTPYEDMGTEFLRTHDKGQKPIVNKIEGQILFQWLKEPEVIEVEAGLKLASKVISAMARKAEDRGSAAYILKQWRILLVNILNQIDEVLGQF